MILCAGMGAHVATHGQIELDSDLGRVGHRTPLQGLQVMKRFLLLTLLVALTSATLAVHVHAGC